MKRWMAEILILISLVFFFFSESGVVNAEKGEEEILEELENSVSDSLNGLDISQFEGYVDSLDESFLEGTPREFIVQLIKGEVNLSPKEVVERLFSLLTVGVRRILPSLCGIVLIAVLFSLIFGLTSDFVKKQTVEIVYFVCFSAIIAIAISLLVNAISSVRNTVELLNGVMNGILPPLLTLMTALGATSGVGLLSPSLGVVATLVANVVTNGVIPLFIASVVFCIVGNLSSSLKLDRIQSAIRYISRALLVLAFGGFSFYLGIVGISSGISDGIKIKTARFLLSSYVPILGGYLSDGFDLVNVGLVLIKNGLGLTGIIVVSAIVLLPVIELASLTLGLKLTAGIIEPISDKRLSSMLGGLAESVRQLVSALLGVGFTFIIILGMVILTVSSI